MQDRTMLAVVEYVLLHVTTSYHIVFSWWLHWLSVGLVIKSSLVRLLAGAL